MRKSGPGVLCASVARFFLVFSTLICPASGFAQVKIRAAYGTPSLSQVVFPLGVQAGMFERNGLNVEPLYIAGRSINLLLSGDVQFGFTGGPQTVLARLSGAELITIAGLNRLGQMIAAHPSIKAPADLVGKRLKFDRETWNAINLSWCSSSTFTCTCNIPTSGFRSPDCSAEFW